MQNRAATHIAAGAAAGAALLGLMAGAGWALHWPALTSVRTPYRPIAPSAACALVLLGLLLATAVGAPRRRRIRTAAQLLAAALALYGLLEPVGSLLGADLNGEDALTAHLAQACAIPFVPISPIAGLAMFLVGSALALLLTPPREAPRRGRVVDLAGGLGAAAATLSLVFVLGYLYGVPLLYGRPTLPIAATSALGFLLLGIGVVAAAGPARWPLRVLAGPSVRARLLRTFVPLTVVVSVAVSVAHETIPALAALNRALEAALVAVVSALVAGLVAFRLADTLGRLIDQAQRAQREAEASLTRQRALLEAVLDQIPVGVHIAEVPSGRLLLGNRQVEEIWRHPNRPAESVEGYREYTVYHSDDGRPYQAEEYPMARAIRTGEVIAGEELAFLRGDGTRGTLLVSAAPVHDEAGRTVLAVAAFLDITARKQAEQALRESEERYRRLFEVTPNLIVVHREGRVEFINQAGVRMLGARRAEEVVGRPVMDFVHPEERTQVGARIDGILEQASPAPTRETRLLRVDGGLLEAEVSAVGVTLNGARCVLVAAHDVTDRKQADRERERLHEDLLRAERARADVAEQMTAEINHRMKNNLTLLSGVLEMQAMDTTPEVSAAHTIRDVISRLTALSVVHEQLYDARSARVELRDVLRRIGEASSGAFAVRAPALRVEGEAVHVSSRLGSTLALLANELITNALEHGATGPSGRLEVVVSLTRQTDGLHLRVWNSGNPVPAGFQAERSRGLGLSLVRGVVGEQLHGSLTMRPEAGGTRTEILVPEGVVRAPEFVPEGGPSAALVAREAAAPPADG